MSDRETTQLREALKAALDEIDSYGPRPGWADRARDLLVRPEELVLAVYKDGPIRRLDATEDRTEFREALAMALSSMIGDPDFTVDIWMEAGRMSAILRGWLPRLTKTPRTIIVTRVVGDGNGDGHDCVLGPTDWQVLEHHDGSTTVFVPPELAGRARELWPDVPIEEAEVGKL